MGSCSVEIGIRLGSRGDPIPKCGIQWKSASRNVGAERDPVQPLCPFIILKGGTDTIQRLGRAGLKEAGPGCLEFYLAVVLHALGIRYDSHLAVPTNMGTAD